MMRVWADHLDGLKDIVEMEGELIEAFRVLPFDDQQLYGRLIIHRAGYIERINSLRDSD